MFSADTIKRLSLYLRNLRRIQRKGIEITSSDKITEFLNVSAEQFRKDLSYFGEFGIRGVGYKGEKLISELESILGIDKRWKIALVGVGRLGSAILGFENFLRFNLKITCAFDIDNDKINKELYEVKIHSVKNLVKVIKKENIKIAIITTPPEAAQYVTDELIDADIKGILNFAPVALRTKNDVSVSNVDMACELESLLFFVGQNTK